MVLKFKIWKLTKVKRKHEYLVLRDKEGKIRRWAGSEAEKQQLRRWYKRYQFQQNLEDQIADKELKARILQAKEAARKMGFTHQLSFYGMTNNENGVKEYRRYEVFSQQEWNKQTVTEVYSWFYQHIPKAEAGVFLYHNGRVLPICLLQKKKEKA